MPALYSASEALPFSIVGDQVSIDMTDASATAGLKTFSVMATPAEAGGTEAFKIFQITLTAPPCSDE